MHNKRIKKALKMYAKFKDKIVMLEEDYKIRNNTAITRLKMIRILDFRLRCVAGVNEMLTFENDQLREENQRLKEELKESR